MSLKDKYTFALAPVDTDSKLMMTYLMKYAQQYAAIQKVDVDVDLSRIMMSNNNKYLLQRLEEYHRVLDLYLVEIFFFH